MTFVEFSRSGDSAWATINRPERSNALGPEIISALNDWIELESGNTDNAALVITGSGKAFCPGADVKASMAMAHDPALRRSFFEAGDAMMAAIVSAEVPVIAAVNGVAFAGGLELALSCDLIVAAETAQFGDLHLLHERIPSWGSSAKLIGTLGQWRGAHALLCPTRFSATEFQRLGVVSEVAPDGSLHQEVMRMVDQFASYDPGALRAMKALIAAHRGEVSDRHFAIEHEHFLRYLDGPQMQKKPENL